jgi:hypothetical protein
MVALKEAKTVNIYYKPNESLSEPEGLEVFN